MKDLCFVFMSLVLTVVVLIGFLFVGGDLDKAQNLVKSLSEKEKIDDFLDGKSGEIKI